MKTIDFNLPDYERFVIKDLQVVMWSEWDHTKWWIATNVWQLLWYKFWTGYREIWRMLWRRTIPRRLCQCAYNLDFKRMEDDQIYYIIRYMDETMDTALEEAIKRRNEYREFYKRGGVSDQDSGAGDVGSTSK